MENMLKRLAFISFWFGPSCLTKIEEMNQNILGKGLFQGSLKGHILLTKWTIQKAGGGWIPIIRICFWDILFKVREMFKKPLSKGHFHFKIGTGGQIPDLKFHKT